MRERTAAWLELHDALRHGAVDHDVLARADRELAEWFRDLDGAEADQVQGVIRRTDPRATPLPPQGRVDPLTPTSRRRRQRPEHPPPPPVEFDDPVRSVLARAVRGVAVLVVLRLRPALSRERRAAGRERRAPARPAPAPRPARARRRPLHLIAPLARLGRVSGGVGRRLVATAVVLGLGLAALAGARLVLEGQHGESLDLPPRTRAEVVGWLAGNVAGHARLAVHPDLRESVAAVLPGREVVSLGQQSGAAYDLVVAPSGAGSGGDLLVATFGALEVRQPPGRTGWAEAREERRSTGQNLVADPRLQLSSAAWTHLVEGDVDARLMDLIGAVLQRTTLDVAAFRRGPAESTDAPMRAMEVTAVGDIRVADGAEAAMSVRSLLMDVPLGVRADGLALATDSNEPALLVRMSLPSR